MAKIDIKMANGSLPSEVAVPNSRPLDYSGLNNIGQEITARANAKLEEAERIRQASIDATYHANSMVDLNDKVEKAKEAHRDKLYSSPDLYKQEVLNTINAEFDNAIKSAPSETAKLQMTKSAAQMKISTSMQLSNDVSEAQVSNSLKNTGDSLDKLTSILYNNPSKYEEVAMQRQMLMQANKSLLDPAVWNKLEEQTSERLDLVFLQGTASKDPQAALELIKNSKFSHLGAENLEKVEYDARKVIDTRIREQEQAAAEAQQEVVLRYKTDLAKTRDLGQASRMVTEILRNEKTLGKNFPALLNEAYGNYDQWKAKQEDVVRVATFTENGVHLSADNPKDLKRAESAFDGFREKYNTMEVGDKANFIKGWLDRVGVLPPSIQTGLIDSLRNGTPDNKAKAAVLLNDLVDSDERLMRQFHGKTKEIALASKIANNLAMDLDPRVAVESAEKDIFQGDNVQSASDPRRKAKIKAYESEKTEIKLGDFTSFWSNDPDELPVEMVAELEDYKRQLVINYDMPESEAHKKAILKGKALWGETEINGELKFTRNPVEKVYGGKGDTSWIRKQLETEVSKVGATVDKTPINAPDLKLIPIPDHMSRTKTPEYLVLHPDKAGFPTPVLKKDPKKGLVPFTWKPSLVATEEYQKVRGVSKAKIQELNTSANALAQDRYRAKLVDQALKNKDISPAMRKRLKDDMRRSVTGQTDKGRVSIDQLEDINDIAPVSLTPKTGPNLKIGK